MVKQIRKIIFNMRCMSVLLLLAFVLGGASAAKAQVAGNPVDLELSGAGASSWNISNIKPGDAGTIAVALKNAGTNAGTVAVWISDIVSTEGANPESETGDTSEPGELDAYLTLNLTCSRLVTNVALPVLLNQFPQSPSGPAYVKINRLEAGETIDLTWQWALPPETGNEVQGDGVTFTINYVIEELPAPPAGGGNDTGTPSYGLLIISETGEVSSATTIELNAAGRVQQAVAISDINRDFMLVMEGGTRVTSNEVEIPRILKITRSDEVLQALGGNGAIRVSPLYEVAVLIGNRNFDSVEFDQPVKIILRYDTRLLLDKNAEVYIGILRDERTIIRLPTEVGTDVGGAYAQAWTTMLATVAVFAEMPLSAYSQAGQMPLVMSTGSADDNLLTPPGLTLQDERTWFKASVNGDGVINSGQKDVSPAKPRRGADVLTGSVSRTGHLLVTIVTIFGYVATSITLLFVFVFRTRPA